MFGVGALIAGVGGALYAHYALFIDSAQFGFHRSAEIFIIVLLGGMGSFWGAVAGAVAVTLLPEALRVIQEWRMTFFGTLLVAMMIWRPWGLIGRPRPRLIPRACRRARSGARRRGLDEVVRRVHGRGRRRRSSSSPAPSTP